MTAIPATAVLKPDLPDIGDQVGSHSAKIIHLARERYEVLVKTPNDLVTIGMSNFDVDIARNSDKVAKTTYQTGTCLLAPSGSLNYARCRNDRANFAMFAIDRRIRDGLMDELGSSACLDDHVEFEGGRLFEAFAITAAQYAKTGASQLAIDALATTSLAMVLRRVVGQDRFDRAFRPSPNVRSIERATEYIESHLGEELSLAVISSVAAMSPYHFSRTFKASQGQSLSNYIAERRIERVKELMVTTELPLVEISYAAGFSSQSRMSTVFRAIVGTTPAKYRHGRFE